MLSSTSPEVTWRSSIELADDPYGPNPENPLPSPVPVPANSPPGGDPTSRPPSPRPPPSPGGRVYDSSPMGGALPSPVSPGLPGGPAGPPGGASTAPLSPAAKLEMVPRNRFQWY